MSTVQRFEDLIAWQLARQLATEVYRMTKHKNFGNDLKLAGQMQSAAVSISSNIAEGFERGSKADFHKFLVMAKASCAEVRSQLYIAKDNGQIIGEDFKQLMQSAERTAALVGGLRESIRAQLKS